MARNLIIGAVLLLIIGGGALYMLTKPVVPTADPIVQDQHASASVQPRSTANSGQASTAGASAVQVSDVRLSTALSPGGTALKPSSVFSPTTPELFAVLSLKNATQRTQLSYIRYYEGKYVESNVSHPSTNGAKYFHFDWILKAGQTRKPGKYTLVFYVDGKKVQTVAYTIR
jgi:hypothetical protein